MVFLKTIVLNLMEANDVQFLFEAGFHMIVSVVKVLTVNSNYVYETIVFTQHVLNNVFIIFQVNML